MVLKFVHAADLHLDSPFVGISGTDPAVWKMLSEATFEAFDNVIELCLKEQVDFLLVAGDVYDGAERSLRAQLRFRDGLTRLAEAGIPSYVVHGNHDPLDGWVSSLRWPDSVHIFGGSNVESVVYRRDGQAKAVIHGISFARRDVRENLALKFTRRDAPLFQIGLLHCNVGSNTGHEPYAPCQLGDLGKAGLDYWALGHVHKHCVLLDGRPYVAYSGSTQGRHANETGPKGCLLVNVDEAGRARTEFVPTDVVRWWRRDFSIDGIETEDALIGQLEGYLEQIQSESEGRASVCVLRLVGRGPLHRVLRRASWVDDLLEELRRFGMRLSPFVWVGAIGLWTYPEVDVAARREKEDILADCLRIVQEYREDATRRGQLGAILAEMFGSRRVAQHLDQPGDEWLLRLLDSAESLLLDELMGEQQ